MSGGYEYNLTTQSQFEEMKQKNQELMEQNYNLKKTLEELIKVNNQLSETIEEFNNSELATSGAFKNIHLNQNASMSANHEECNKMVQELGEQIQYFKGLAYEKIDNEENTQIFNALESLIQSFKQTQKLYQDQLMAICEEVENIRNQWQSKALSLQKQYFEKSKVLEEVMRQLKKKEEIVSIIEKKISEPSKSPRKLLKKNSQIDTSSERKVNNHNPRQVTDSNTKQKIDNSNKEIEELKKKQKKLNQQLKQKQKTIAIYTELLSKIRKKLSERY